MDRPEEYNAMVHLSKDNKMSKSCMAKVCLSNDVESYCDKLEDRMKELEDLEIAHKTLQRINGELNVKNSKLEADKMELIEGLTRLFKYEEKCYLDTGDPLADERFGDDWGDIEQLLARMEEKDEM